MTKYMKAWIGGVVSIVALLLLVAVGPLSNPTDMSSVGYDVCVSDAAGGCLQNEAASVTNPTLIPDKTDPDTGIGGDGANSLSLITGGVEAIRVDSSQRVMIGTTSTTDNLHVEESTAGQAASIAIRHGDNTNSASDSTLNLITFDAAGGDPSVVFSIINVNDWGLGVDNSDGDKFKIATTADIAGTARLTIDRNGDVGIGTSNPDRLAHIAGAVDGDFVGLLVENSQANAALSTNETAQIRFGFGGINDVARISADKMGDYTTATEQDSRLAFQVDIDGTPTMIAHFMFDGLMLMLPNSRIRFSGDAGGGGQAIQYKDSTGSMRNTLMFPGSDIVMLGNRAANGVVEIRANTSTGGSGGEVTVAEFQDDVISFLVSGGNIDIGAEGGGQTQLRLKGADATGTSEGGELQLFVADDFDTTINSWRIDAFEDDLRFGFAGGNPLMIIASGVIRMSDLSGGDGSSHVCVDASGNLFNQEASC